MATALFAKLKWMSTIKVWTTLVGRSCGLPPAGSSPLDQAGNHPVRDDIPTDQVHAEHNPTFDRPKMTLCYCGSAVRDWPQAEWHLMSGQHE